MACTKALILADHKAFGMIHRTKNSQTPNHNCEQTLCKKNRNRTHQDQRSTGAMNLPWLRSLRGLKVDETLLLLFVVVRHLPCLNRRCTFTMRVRTIRTTRHLHCSIVQKRILKLCWVLVFFQCNNHNINCSI